MIKYRLSCNCGHSFDKWFKNMAEYDELFETNKLECPECRGNKVKKAIMAPAIDSEGLSSKTYSQKGQAAEAFSKSRDSSCNICSPGGTCPFSA